MKRFLMAVLASMAIPLAAAEPPAPAIDHHQHLFSPGIVALLASPAVKPLDAHRLVALLDEAGIRRAVVLSVAYMYGRPSRVVEDEYGKVRAENDWTAAQAAQYPDRLRAFCGVNPLKEYALREIARCAADQRLRHGLKLHFGNSDVRLEVPEHAARLREVFAAANRHGMAIAVHMRASVSLKRPYGREQARIFLEQLLTAAPDVPVQVAHFAGTGPGYDDPPAHEVMEALADAVAQGDPRTRRLWFDIATVVDREIAPDTAARVAALVRRVGVDRVLFGSDAATAPERSPNAWWEALRRLPLSDAELARIASNEAPYWR